MAQEEDLFVLLRPGPYICAEREMGGFPPWLLTMNPNMRLRTNDSSYTGRVKIWFDQLFEKMKPLLYGNGGPIIMVQVENEYGSYFACDYDYTAWLRDLMKGYIGDAAVLYTTDGSSTSFLKCGKIDGVYATVDFGAGTNPSYAFGVQKKYEPKGPSVNSEFYPGWLTHWGENFMRVDTKAVADTLDKILTLNASVSVYMFFGGTNFGFLAGANYANNYQPHITSYDYDAPLTEAGDPTDKYFAMRDVIKKYLPLPNVTLPVASPKANYGTVELKRVAGILDAETRNGLGLAPVNQKYPLSFEAMGQSYGFVLYETQLGSISGDPASLKVTGLRDRANVLLNGVSQGILSRVDNNNQMPLSISGGESLQMFVENQGRINFGNNINDSKGIIENVTINGIRVEDWTMTGFPLHDISWVENTSPIHSTGFPAFYYGEFTLPDSEEEPKDTYLKPVGWDKGVAFINGINLGRYWPTVGPQVTLYVPGIYLKSAPEVNKLVILELEKAPTELSMSFVDTPQLDL